MNNISGDKKQDLLYTIYNWCLENGFTPYISVKIYSNMDKQLWKHEKNNEIIFNISPSAVCDLIINDYGVNFSARFNGVLKSLKIPLDAVSGIFAKEVNQGIQFSILGNDIVSDDISTVMDNKIKDFKLETSRSHLKLVK